MEPSSHDVTQLLVAWSDGDEAALEKLTPLVEAELHRLARRYMRNERAGHTLQTTALVNEAYLKLIDWKNVRWQNRAHFFGIASQAMRRILVDHARAHAAGKRGSGDQKVSIEDVQLAALAPDIDILALDEVLTRLASLDPQQSRVVELRFFGGLTMEETAEVLQISPATVGREWTPAKAWLFAELRGRTP